MKQSPLSLYFNGYLCISWSFCEDSSSPEIMDDFKAKEVGTYLN